VPQLTSFVAASSSPGWTCTPDGNSGSSCTLQVGSVAAGSSVTFTFAVQVANAFPPDPPPIENSACVSTTSGGDPQDNDCGSTSTPPGGNPDVRMVKSVASGSASPGSVLVYALEVSNIGDLDAAGVSLEETVPQLTSFLAASSSPGWACTPDGDAGSSCMLTVGTVAAGSSATYTFAVQVADEFPPNPPPIENSACVRTTSGGNPEDNDCDGTSTPPGGSPELTLSKALTSGTVVPNGVLVFTLTLDNSGTREATGVVLQETVPASSVFEAASSSPGWICAGEGAAGAACTLAVGTVAAGVSASFTFAVRLPPDLAPGTQVANTACVEEAGGETDPDGTNCRTVIIDPPGPETDLEVTLTVDETLRQPGVPFTFTLTVHNASAVPAQGLRLTVSLPSFGTEPTELDPACQNPGGAVLECSVAELAGGASASFTWRQPAFQTGDYTVSAELMEAAPEDVDSVPGNGSRTEDDYAEVTVVVSAEQEVHDIPTLSTVGLTAMVLLLVALGVVAMRRGAYRSAPGA
jgi:large repetitive protein